MRGKLRRRKCFAAFSRITPADAGKTEELVEVTNKYKDHPRGCGENSKTYVDVRGTVGSPPRMRGKPFIVDGSTWKVRITPADAGKT